MKIEEKPIVEEKVLVKGLVMAEKLFDQVPRLSQAGAELMEWTDEWVYGWVQYWPKGSTSRSQYILFLKGGKLYKSGLFTETMWQGAKENWPQVYIK